MPTTAVRARQGDDLVPGGRRGLGGVVGMDADRGEEIGMCGREGDAGGAGRRRWCRRPRSARRRRRGALQHGRQVGGELLGVEVRVGVDEGGHVRPSSPSRCGDFSASSSPRCSRFTARSFSSSAWRRRRSTAASVALQVGDALRSADDQPRQQVVQGQKLIVVKPLGYEPVKDGGTWRRTRNRPSAVVSRPVLRYRCPRSRFSGGAALDAGPRKGVADVASAATDSRAETISCNTAWVCGVDHGRFSSSPPGPGGSPPPAGPARTGLGAAFGSPADTAACCCGMNAVHALPAQRRPAGSTAMPSRTTAAAMTRRTPPRPTGSGSGTGARPPGPRPAPR